MDALGVSPPNEQAPETSLLFALAIAPPYAPPAPPKPALVFAVFDPLGYSAPEVAAIDEIYCYATAPDNVESEPDPSAHAICIGVGIAQRDRHPWGSDGQYSTVIGDCFVRAVTITRSQNG